MAFSPLPLPLLLLLLVPVLRAQVVLEPPSGGDGTALGFLLVPGAMIRPEQYRPLAEAIQNRSSFRTWVGLVGDFLIDTPNPLQLSAKIDATLAEMRARGLPADAPLAIAGHSLGGVFLPSHVRSRPGRYAATLLFAAYLSRGDLAAFPTPVLHLSGDLDGQTRLTRILPTFLELQALPSPSQALLKRPVVLMAGQNHGQFASGPMPSTVRNNDLPAEVDAAAAWNNIAAHTEHFLSVNLGGQGQPAAIKALRAAHNATAAILAPLVAAAAADVDGTRSPLVETAQRRLLDGLVASEESLQVTDKVQNGLVAIMGAKPSLSGGAGSVSVSTASYLAQPLNPADISLNPVTTGQVYAKMKRRSAVARALGLADDGQEVSCAQINRLVVQRALGLASEAARRRYERSGRNVTFLEDRQTSMGPEWIARGLELNYKAPGGLSVRGVALRTSPDGWIASIAGMHYCKLLAVSRALEWVYVDSLRPRST